ncbi:MAG: aminoglycoside phosphotransferase family protein [Labilithrix sp.]|nr:aminoglycoside phosphotransferase family protein [Labilithrix sp.]
MSSAPPRPDAPATVTVERAVEETRALAAELGVEAEPAVVADKSNLVLRLAPHPIVARVAMATSLVRVGMAWLRREVEISRFLAERGCGVTRPSTRLPAGPFERGGLVISFWDEEEIVADRPDPRAAGAALREAQRALARYDATALPVWGSVDEARQVFARARFFTGPELRRMKHAWEEVDGIVASAPSRTASFQAVHGDAHIGNVLATARGPVWTDWEDAFVGPVEWDIASLRSKAELFGEERSDIEAMTAAYGADYDVDLARDLGLVRNVQVISWLAIFAERQPDLLARMRMRLDRLP